MTNKTPASSPTAPAGRRRSAAALAWSAGAVLLAAAWLLGLLPHPFGNGEALNVGAVLNGFDPRVGGTVVLVTGIIGLICAFQARPDRGTPGRITVVTSWALTGVTALVLLHGGLLPVLGYTPVVIFAGWSIPGLPAAYLARLGDPETLFLLYALAGAALWALTSLSVTRALRDACRTCGRTGGWSAERELAVRAKALIIGRIAVAAGIAAALVYPSIRIPWLFGVFPGMTAAEAVELQGSSAILTVGLGLGSFALVGAVLMLGLVQRWGERFPRWFVGLSGRRVPVALAVIPATGVAFALIAFGKGVILTWLGGALWTDGAPAGAHNWVHELAFASMLVWGLALVAATAAYAVRRRTECDRCGRGYPEGLDLPHTDGRAITEAILISQRQRP